MKDRLLLSQLDLSAGTLTSEGKTYPLNSADFPTLKPDSPYVLTQEERTVLNDLKAAFIGSSRLQQHIRFLLEKGSMYLCYNDNLL